MLRDYGYRPLHRRRLVGLAVVGVLVLSLAGVYFALTNDPTVDSTIDPSEAFSQTQLRTPPTAAPAHASVRPLRTTPDPETFVKVVAHALFDWDSASPIGLIDYAGRLVAVADPSGDESPGLVSDIANYLPTSAAWAELHKYYTQQWIEITSVTFPTLWPQAVAEAGRNGLRPGTTAYTIDGVRHRSGVWDGEPVATDHDVAFTVFIVCRPSYPTCHLLRLSKLDDPLD